MSRTGISVFLFACFAIGLPLVAMQANEYDRLSVHRCTGPCYEDWVSATGGILSIAQAKAQARAEASPAELGELAYAGCVACHGASGEGGVGPVLAGQAAGDIVASLNQYKNGETRGSQSALMWSQAATLSDGDIANLAAYIESL